MRICLTILAVGVLLAGNWNPAFAQIDFDRPDVIQTSFSRQMAAEQKKRPIRASYTAPIQPQSDCNCGAGEVYADYGGDTGYGDTCGVSPGYMDAGSGCCGHCHDNGSFGSDYCNTGSRFSLMVGGIIDIPVDGVFHTGDDARVTAGDLGIAPTTLTAATPIDLLVNEMGFDDIYQNFAGAETNLKFQKSCNTSFFIGYRFVEGRAEDAVTVGNAIVNPLTVPVTHDLNAQFSEYRESQLQAGFLTSRCLMGNLDFVWGSRTGIGFVDDITATFEVPGIVTLDDVRFYDDTTNFTFGVNLGLQMNIGCRGSVYVLSGAEYRTSLNQVDTQLATIGLEELNDGSGFASIPIYMGFNFRR